MAIKNYLEPKENLDYIDSQDIKPAEESIEELSAFL